MSPISPFLGLALAGGMHWPITKQMIMVLTLLYDQNKIHKGGLFNMFIHKKKKKVIIVMIRG